MKLQHHPLTFCRHFIREVDTHPCDLTKKVSKRRSAFWHRDRPHAYCLIHLVRRRSCHKSGESLHAYDTIVPLQLNTRLAHGSSATAESDQKVTQLPVDWRPIMDKVS